MSHPLSVRWCVVAAIAALGVLASPGAAQETGRGDKYALLIGVSRYDPKELHDLPYAEADATDLAKVLIDRAGWSKDHVVLMTQAAASEKLRYAPEAKKIRQELKAMLRLCEDGDTLLIAFAGHGVQFSGEDETYFCPADARLDDRQTLIALGEEVYKGLESCKADLKVLLVDACRDDPRTVASRSAAQVDLESVTRPQKLAPPGGTAAFFSCSAGERAYEHPDLKHGVFFHFVMEGLSGQAADADGQVTLPDLEKYVKREVKTFTYNEFGASQRPEMVNKTRELIPLVRGAPPGAPAVLLAWKFEKGRTLYQEMTTTTDQTMTVMGSDVKQKQSQTFYLTWEPLGMDENGNWRIKQRIDGVKMSIEIGGNHIEYDSTSDSKEIKNPLNDFFRALIGSEFTMTVKAAKGRPVRVEKIDGAKEFVDKLAAANPQLKPLLEKIVNDEVFKEMSRVTFDGAPNMVVTRGRSWTTNSRLDMGPVGQYDTTYKYTYVGTEKIGDQDLEKIKVDSDMTYRAPKEGDQSLPFRIKKADLASSGGSGEILFDAQAGRVAQSSLTLELSGDLDIEIGGATTNVKLNQKQTSQLRTSDRSFLK